MMRMHSDLLDCARCTWGTLAAASVLLILEASGGYVFNACIAGACVSCQVHGQRNTRYALLCSLKLRLCMPWHLQRKNSGQLVHWSLSSAHWASVWLLEGRILGNGHAAAGGIRRVNHVTIKTSESKIVLKLYGTARKTCLHT